MDIIPENLAAIAPILSQYLAPLLNWLSQQVYERLLAHAANHPLVQLARLLDFRSLERACAGYRHQGGRGRPNVHTVAKLLRALFVKYWFDWSLRRLEEEIRYNLLVKWFVGYALYEEGPDHTTLHRFEVYLYQEHPRRFFDSVLEQIDASVEDGHEQVQIGDTFALRANAALESLLQRLRHSSYQLLHAWQASDPEGYAAIYPHLDGEALFGLKGEQPEYTLASGQWRQRLLLTVTVVESCLGLLPPAATNSAAVQRRVEQLSKIMSDELELARDEKGRLIGVSLLPKKQRGRRCICSATDPEATIRNHGEHKKDFGANVSLAVTPTFIREIRADTGCSADVSAIPAMLAGQAEHHDVCPEKLIYDQIAGTGKTVHEVAVASGGQTQLVAKPMPPKQSPTFGPEAFTLSDDGLWLTCPNGRRSNRRYGAGSGDGAIFRFTPPHCLGCSLVKPCRGSEKTPTTKRDVFISDYRPEYDRLVAYSQTAAFKADMKLRPHVERIIAALVGHNGARRARFVGLKKMDFQMKMCAMSYNAKRWLVLLAEKEGRHRRQPRRRWELPVPTGGLSC